MTIPRDEVISMAQTAGVPNGIATIYAFELKHLVNIAYAEGVADITAALNAGVIAFGLQGKEVKLETMSPEQSRLVPLISQCVIDALISRGKQIRAGTKP